MESSYTKSKHDLPMLEKWNEAAATGLGISVLGEAQGLRKDLNLARGKMKMLKGQRDYAILAEEDMSELDDKVSAAKDEVKRAQNDLNNAFRVAFNDLKHFPELASDLTKLMGFSSDLVEIWGDGKSFDDFEELKKLDSGNGRHQVSLVQPSPGQGERCIVLKKYVIGDPNNTQNIKYFAEEVKKMRELKHPSIMPLLGVFIDGDAMFIEMPYCEGGDLLTYVQRHQPAVPRLRVVLSQVLDGIIKMHDNNVIHGDIKPNNVLMTTASRNSSRPKLTDFETSRNAAASITQTRIGGTLAYMSPEIKNGANANKKSDIYAFGKLLEEVMKAVEDIVESDKEEVNEVISSCTNHQPEDRPSAADLKEFSFFSHTEEAAEEEFECICMAECAGIPQLKSNCVFCPGKARHVLCREDFNAYVSGVLSSPDFIAVQNPGAGMIYCCNRPQGCKSAPFSDEQVVINLNDENLTLYFDKKKELLEGRAALRNEIEITRRAAEELKELVRMSEFEKKVRAARKEIEDNLLNTKCPGCKTAFIDWDNCAALSCRSCPVKFCCYCQKDCSGDAHNHVLDCPECPAPPAGGSKLYPHQTPGFYESVMANIKEKRVREFIKTLEEDVKVEVMQQCARSFQDLGMKFPEYAGIQHHNQGRQRSDSDIARNMQFDEYHM